MMRFGADKKFWPDLVSILPSTMFGRRYICLNSISYGTEDSRDDAGQGEGRKSSYLLAPATQMYPSLLTGFSADQFGLR